MNINDLFTVISGVADIIVIGLAVYVIFIKHPVSQAEEEEEEVTT